MKKQKNVKFINVHHESVLWDADAFVYVDKATNVQYLAIKHDRGVGITLMVDQNGKPLLYQPTDENDS